MQDLHGPWMTDGGPPDENTDIIDSRGTIIGMLYTAHEYNPPVSQDVVNLIESAPEILETMSTIGDKVQSILDDKAALPKRIKAALEDIREDISFMLKFIEIGPWDKEPASTGLDPGLCPVCQRVPVPDPYHDPDFCKG